MQNIFKFLEKLRRETGSKNVEDFLNDIIETRQYYRFQDTPNNKSRPYLEDFIKLVSQTNFSVTEVLDFYLEEITIERVTTTRMYNNLIRENFKAYYADKLLIEKEEFMEMKNFLLYKYTLIKHDHKKNIIHDSHYLSELKKLINYPKILNNELISLIELMIIGEILYYVPNSEQTIIVKKIKSILEKQGLLINPLERNDKLLQLISRMANFTGDKGDFLSSIEFCKKGIEISLKYEEFYLLDYLYYYLSLGLHYLSKFKERDIAIHDCYLVLLSKKNSDETKKFLKWFEQDFEINIDAFIKKYNL